VFVEFPYRVSLSDAVDTIAQVFYPGCLCSWNSMEFPYRVILIDTENGYSNTSLLGVKFVVCLLIRFSISLHGVFQDGNWFVCQFQR